MQCVRIECVLKLSNQTLYKQIYNIIIILNIQNF